MDKFWWATSNESNDVALETLICCCPAQVSLVSLVVSCLSGASSIPSSILPSYNGHRLHLLLFHRNLRGIRLRQQFFQDPCQREQSSKARNLLALPAILLLNLPEFTFSPSHQLPSPCCSPRFSHTSSHHGERSPIQVLYRPEVSWPTLPISHCTMLTSSSTGPEPQGCVRRSLSSNNPTTASPSSPPFSSPFLKVQRDHSSSLVATEDIGTQRWSS